MPLYFDKKSEISTPTSAFKPYKKVVKEEPKSDNETVLDKKKISSIVDNPTKNETIAELSEADILYQQAVEMETIVSNLGRFKQGHLCVFCGKVYSRKYGLKIHTRLVQKCSIKRKFDFQKTNFLSFRLELTPDSGL